MAEGTFTNRPLSHNESQKVGERSIGSLSGILKFRGAGPSRRNPRRKVQSSGESGGSSPRR
jgi:hypothetical protein